MLSLLLQAQSFAPASRLGAPARSVTPRNAVLAMSDLVWTPSARGEPGKTPRDLEYGPLTQYCEDLYTVGRRKTRTVEAGPVKFGSEHPIVRQTMATTLTSDVEATVDQVIRCADEGFDLVRVTVVGMKDAKACLKIREELDSRGYSIPLCADMHFQPKVALVVADAVEKIRVNPGNFADGRKTFEELVYETDEQYFAERDYIEETFKPLARRRRRPASPSLAQLRPGLSLAPPALPVTPARSHLPATALAGAQVQGAQPVHAHRHQPRLALRARPLLLRRHAARHGRVGHRVCGHLPLSRLPQVRPSRTVTPRAARAGV